MAWDKKIPFNSNNDMVASVNYWNQNEITWKNNYVFEDHLRYIGMLKNGRNVTRIIWKCYEGKRYEMFFSDFNELMEKEGINVRSVIGNWTFCKRGIFFGIKFVFN